MWSRLRRRTFAPSKPLLYPEQLALAFVSIAAIVAGVYLAVHAL